MWVPTQIKQRLPPSGCSNVVYLLLFLTAAIILFGARHLQVFLLGFERRRSADDLFRHWPTILKHTQLLLSAASLNLSIERLST